ncbi:MAG: YafY family transcriptional regulator [Proteobacteria bacterium]|nr:YafY family transcriptional regulator [Pseudomonadota bacterium]
MSRAVRLLDLVQLLRRRRHPVRGEELARELAISLRTLYRDIASLQAQGAPIDGEPGLGYVLRPGFTLPPLMFTEDEVEALMLGSHWVAENGDPRLAQAAMDVMAKVAAVLPPDRRAQFDNPSLLIVTRSNNLAAMAPIRDAIRREHKLEIDYRDAGSAATHRTIWPFAVGFFEEARIVVAWCELRQDYRHFRIDRIGNLLETDARYPKRRAAMLKDWQKQMGIGPR